MTRPDVRAAVDAAVRRHLDARRAARPADGPRPVAPLRAEQQAGGASAAEGAAGPSPASSGQAARPGTELGSTSGAPGTPPPSSGPHASHGRFPRAARPGDPPEGRCVIEPEAECVGSGYCRSHGY